MISLKKGERLVCAGVAALRAPDGTPLEGVRQYMIVPASTAAGEEVTALDGNERMVLAGMVCDRQRAEERYTAALEGRRCSPPRGTPLYIKASAGELGMSAGEKAVCEQIVGDLAAALHASAQQMEALGQRGQRSRAKAR